MKNVLFLLIVGMLTLGSVSAEKFYSEDFTGTANAVFDGSSPEVNLLGTGNKLQGWGATQYFTADGASLSLRRTGGVRFDSGYNWANLANIIGDNATMTITFDYRNGSASDYIAFGLGLDGTPSGNTIYNLSDYGFRVESDRFLTFLKETTTVDYNSDTANAFNIGTNTWGTLRVTLAFANFDTGSIVTLNAAVGLRGGTLTNLNVNKTFALEFTDNFVIDIGGYNAGGTVYMDNLVIDIDSPTMMKLTYPAYGQNEVELNPTLQWDGIGDPNNPNLLDSRVLKHYVWMDTNNTDGDPNLYLVSTITVSDWSSRAASYGPLSLGYDQSVSWRIEEGLDNGAGGAYSAGEPNNVLGPIWKFNSRKSIPVVPTTPLAGVRVFAGETAAFTVNFTSVSTPTVTWYYYNTITEVPAAGTVNTVNNGGGSYTTTLTFASVAAFNEGQYYCKVSNASGPTAYQSGTGELVVKRQLAQYSFDGNLADSSGNGAPAGTAIDSKGDPNTATHVAGTVSYVTGADGVASGALYLDPNEYINFGAGGYPKASAVTTNGFGGGLDEGSVVYWIKPVGDWAQIILGNSNNGSTTAFSSEIAAGGEHRLFIRGASGNALYAQDAPGRPEYDIADGNWHMFASCWSGNAVRIYVDGELVEDVTGSTPGSFTAWQYDVLLGAARTTANRLFLASTFDGGAIDNLKIYNFRLDESGTDVFAQEYLNNTGILPCTNPSFLAGLSNANLDNSGSSYCKVDLADFAALAEAWLLDGLY